MVRVRYDDLADNYARHRRCNPAVMDGLVTGGRLTASSSVLEVGAGTGNYSLALHERTGCRCTAVEPSDAMRDVLQKARGDVQVVAGIAEQLPLPGDTFDLVFCVDVVHHMSDLAAFFSEAFRVLGSHGQVCVVTDSEEIIRTRFPLADYFPETVEADLKRYPTVGRLRAAAEAAGFHGWRQDEITTTAPLSSADVYAAKSFSVLHLISAAGFAEGLARVREDLQRGSLLAVGSYVLLWASK